MPHEGPAALVGLALALAAGAAAAQDSAAGDSSGASVFAQTCAACHQADGSGTPGLAPQLKGTYWQKLLAQRSYLPRVIAFGLTGQIKVGDSVFNGGMPGQVQLTDGQVAAVANHVAAGLNTAQLPPDWKPYDAAEVAGLRATPHASLEQRQLRKQALAP
jgi:mono/diheme cytochrome c family protein